MNERASEYRTSEQWRIPGMGECERESCVQELLLRKELCKVLHGERAMQTRCAAVGGDICHSVEDGKTKL